MSTIGTILIVLLVLALLGGFRDWGYGPGYGYGHVGTGGIGGLLVIVVVILLLTGRL